jgi:hypothetical protein
MFAAVFFLIFCRKFRRNVSCGFENRRKWLPTKVLVGNQNPQETCFLQIFCPNPQENPQEIGRFLVVVVRYIRKMCRLIYIVYILLILLKYHGYFNNILYFLCGHWPSQTTLASATYLISISEHYPNKTDVYRSVHPIRVRQKPEVRSNPKKTQKNNRDWF